MRWAAVPNSVMRRCSLSTFIHCVYALQTHFNHVMRLHASCSPLLPSVLYRCHCLGYICFTVHCLALHLQRAPFKYCSANRISHLCPGFLRLFTTESGALVQRYPQCLRKDFWKAEDSAFMAPELECFMDLSDFFITSLGR